MAEVAPQPHMSFEDYLAAEQASDIKHEWLEGVVYAMGATTLEHSRLAGSDGLCCGQAGGAPGRHVAL